MKSKKTVVAVIQARMGSKRLPGKVMENINGKPMLYHVLNRAMKSKMIDAAIVATSAEESDNVLESYCRRQDVACFRGSLDDVLDRYYQAAKRFGADVIVRVTADCPLLDGSVIDSVIRKFMEGHFDYVSNVMECTYPDGLDTEVVSFAALELAWQRAKLKSEREHVTPFIRNNPDLFRLANVNYGKNLSHLRWTVDEPEDLDFVRSIFANFEEADFGMEDTILFLEHHPELTGINIGTGRNEGYIKSLREDRLFAV